MPAVFSPQKYPIGYPLRTVKLKRVVKKLVGKAVDNTIGSRNFPDLIFVVGSRSGTTE